MASKADYTVEIAAQMSNLDYTLSELDSLTEKLRGGGRFADHFETAVKQVSSQLDAAGANSRAASQALALGNEEYKALEKSALEAARSEQQAQSALSKAASESAKAASSLEEVRAKYTALEIASRDLAAAEAEAAQQGVIPPGLSSQAEEAAKALERYASTLGRAEAKARDAGDRETALARDLETMRAASGSAASAVDAYASRLAQLEAEAAGAKAKQEQLAQTLANVNKLYRHTKDNLGDATTNLSTFRGALGDVGGPLGEFGERLLFPAQAFVDLKERFSGMVAASTVAVIGIAAVGAALVAVSAMAVAATVKFAAWTIGLANSARQADITRQALEAMTPELASLRGEMSRIESDTGVAEDSLRGLTKSLLDAKVKSADLPKALRAAALAEAALGKGGAASFVRDIKAGKLAVDEFAATTQTKFGGLVARQMLGLEAQSNRFKSNLGRLFGGLNIEPALEGLSTLVKLFDENEVAGKTIKFLFESVFQPLIDQAQKAAYVVEAFGLGFLIGLTKIYIAVKPVIAAVAKLFGFEDTTLADVLGYAKKAGEALAVVFVVVVAAVGALTAAFAVVVTAVAAATAAAVTLAAAVVAVGVAIAALVVKIVTSIPQAIAAIVQFGSNLVASIGQAIESAKAYLASIDWGATGSAIMQGIAAGVASGAGALLGSITSAVQGAITKAKSLLGIASPSKVFAAIGEDTGAGFATGVEQESSAAEQAMAELVAPPEVPEFAQPANDTLASPLAQVDALVPPRPPTTPTSVATADAPASGKSVSLSGVTFNFYGVEGAEQAQQRFEETLTRVLEGDAASLGGEAAA